MKNLNALTTALEEIKVSSNIDETEIILVAKLDKNKYCTIERFRSSQDYGFGLEFNLELSDDVMTKNDIEEMLDSLSGSFHYLKTECESNLHKHIYDNSVKNKSHYVDGDNLVYAFRERNDDDQFVINSYIQEETDNEEEYYVLVLNHIDC